MLRIPVKSSLVQRKISIRRKSSNSIRSTFLEYFIGSHGHKNVKSSSVVPLCDPTVPFVNAGMNQFKGIFLGKVEAPCSRAVNSQKCIRVGGKHNDLDVVGTDGTHHTFFEMLGNWSFGDYYKKEACQMAWDLLLGPYRLKPENLVVTYFSGDADIGLPEDTECRDIWKNLGVQSSHLKGLGARDNFWEMGSSGPCGPCTEIHYINPDGSLTEIWNIVFIQCNREADGSVKPLSRQYVDTGMGLERMATLLQRVPSNYDTDLFQPIIRAIEKNSRAVSPYGGSYAKADVLDCAYRRLADHARMISICLADGAFPATSLNLKQIMRKTFKISTDVFKNPNLLHILYSEVATTLGEAYPELVAKEQEAKLIIEHERQAYSKMRSGFNKKWNELVNLYPEVKKLSDVEFGGFTLGYKEFKETMLKNSKKVVPGELVFKLYDTHGFHEEDILRIAELNGLTIDKDGFSNLLSEHKQRHKTAFKEQSYKRGTTFERIIDNLIDGGIIRTNDQFKYDYNVIDNRIEFPLLRTKLLSIVNEDCERIDLLDPCENKPYYLVTEDSNFYCEEGGQIGDDSGFVNFSESLTFNLVNVFKIRDFVFHKGYFVLSGKGHQYVKCNSEVVLEVDSVKRSNAMKNHTAIHLLNAAIRKVLPGSAVCQIGSSVTDKGFCLNLSVYGEKISQRVLLEAQELVRQSIASDSPMATVVMDSVQLSRQPPVVTVPGEVYPETGLRLVVAKAPLISRELCCGTHVPSTGHIEDFCITLVKGAGGNTPAVHALTGDAAKRVRELFLRVQKLGHVIELIDAERRKEEFTQLKRSLNELCGSSGRPYGEYAQCLTYLDSLMKRPVDRNDMALHAIAETEVSEVIQQAADDGRRFLVHFLRCSYLMQGDGLARVFAATNLSPQCLSAPTMLLGCAGGVILAACTVPQELVSDSFSAHRWLGCIVPVFKADVMPAKDGRCTLTYAEMTATKVSLINCEQLVQDAMRIAIKFAQSHLQKTDTEQNMQRN